MAGNIVPRTDGGSNLGTADKEFNVIYAKSFGGTIASQVVTTNSPTFTGTPAAPTAAAGTDTTQIATTAFANAAASAAASSAISTHNLASDAHSATIAAAINTHNAATDAHSTEFAKYLPLSGGTMSGGINFPVSVNGWTISGVETNCSVAFKSTENYNDGACLILRGKDAASGNGLFDLRAQDGTVTKRLVGKPDGTLTWCETPIKSMAFPSSTTVPLTILPTTAPTTETTCTYNAPANGYISVRYKIVKNVLHNVQAYSISDVYRDYSNETYENVKIMFFPVLKGRTVNFYFLQAYVIVQQFVYAEGEV